MSDEKIYILDDRSVIFICGVDSKEFLQNIITNDIEKVSFTSCCFASILTPQGKYLFDFIVSKHKNGYFLDCEKTQADDLFKQLMIYKLRSKVDILNLSNEFVISVISKKKFLTLSKIQNTSTNTIKFNEDTIMLDPRTSQLGARLIINLEKLYMMVKKMNLKISDNHEYYDLSHKLGIPPMDKQKIQNKLFGIECNFEELNGIDFKKGCYVGQENTARIKLKKKLSKRLLPIQLIEGKISIDQIITDENNKDIGKVLIDGEYSFALIKFLTEGFDSQKIYHCYPAKIKMLKTKWI